MSKLEVSYHAFRRGEPESRLRRWERRLRKLLIHPEPNVRLWAAALRQAILDLHDDDPELRAESLVWLNAEAIDEVGRFFWLCEELDLGAHTQIRYDILEDAGIEL